MTIEGEIFFVQQRIYRKEIHTLTYKWKIEQLKKKKQKNLKKH